MRIIIQYPFLQDVTGQDPFQNSNLFSLWISFSVHLSRLEGGNWVIHISFFLLRPSQPCLIMSITPPLWSFWAWRLRRAPGESSSSSRCRQWPVEEEHSKTGMINWEVASEDIQVQETGGVKGKKLLTVYEPLRIKEKAANMTFYTLTPGVKKWRTKPREFFLSSSSHTCRSTCPLCSIGLSLHTHAKHFSHGQDICRGLQQVKSFESVLLLV